MIKYLLEADLSNTDLQKLRCTKYLPAENDQTHVYGPSELYLKDEELKVFPFVRFLQWPASEGMSKAQRDFVIKLGIKVNPPLERVMRLLERKIEGDKDEKAHATGLKYLTDRLGPQGLYHKEFAKYKSTKFLPCIRQNLETGEVVREMQSPLGE